MRRKLNRDEKRALQSAAIATFVRQYGRRRPKSGEPNDRAYDRELEADLKRLSPERLDILIRDDEGD